MEKKVEQEAVGAVAGGGDGFLSGCCKKEREGQINDDGENDG